MGDGFRGRTVAAMVGLLALAAAAPAADALLARIRAVGREGAGNREAAAAWKEVTSRGPEALPDVLAAMDGAGPVAANWLRVAADAIAERAVAGHQSLPTDRLEQFIKDTRHASAARRIAYEWLVRVDPSTPGRLLPGMLHDPGPELRRDAVAVAIDKARGVDAKAHKDEAVAAWRKALGGACDRDQVDEIVKQIKALGVEVDVAAHFGFVRRWHLAWPFDNPRGRNFDTVYPPEKGVDLAAVCKGKSGALVRWKAYTTADPYGLVDLNKAIGKEKGAIAYAHAVIDSPAERPVEVRIGTPNAIKVFLNGKEVFGRDEYHHGLAVDQHVGKGVLKAGRNELLVKCCQNEQTEEWAQAWIFQVRLCDATGAAVPWTAEKEEVKP
jgi:hypothetical protein